VDVLYFHPQLPPPRLHPRTDDSHNVVLHISQSASVVIGLREVPLPRPRRQDLTKSGDALLLFIVLSCPLNMSCMGRRSPPSELATSALI
jgi:hypothetical protein